MAAATVSPSSSSAGPSVTGASVSTPSYLSTSNLNLGAVSDWLVGGVSSVLAFNTWPTTWSVGFTSYALAGLFGGLSGFMGKTSSISPASASEPYWLFRSIALSVGLVAFALASLQTVGIGMSSWMYWGAMGIAGMFALDAYVNKWDRRLSLIEYPALLTILGAAFYGMFAGKVAFSGTRIASRWLLAAVTMFFLREPLTKPFTSSGLSHPLNRMIKIGALVCMYMAYRTSSIWSKAGSWWSNWYHGSLSSGPNPASSFINSL
jgi:hypothetical protein